MEMKYRGMYVSRQLSFKNVTFKVDEVSLSPKEVNVYNESAQLWVQLVQSFTKAADLLNFDGKKRKLMWSQFWMAHKMFFKLLVVSAKVRQVVKLTSEALKNGKCVVIGLKFTGESQTLEEVENETELQDFVSTSKGVLKSLVEKYFPDNDQLIYGKSANSSTSLGGKKYFLKSSVQKCIY